MRSLVLALALAVAAPHATDDELLRGPTTTIEEYAIRIPSCGAFGGQDGERGLTVVDVRARVPFPDVDAQQRYTGRPQFTIVRIRVRLPRTITWPGMTERERDALEATLAALRHHEAGHVRVAVAEVARLNAAPLTVTPDAEVYRRTVTRRANEGLASLSEAQRDYDELTDHGRRQERAPGALRGPRTELLCSAGS